MSSARPASTGRRARRRGRTLEHAIYEAVLVQLGEVGYRALTMEQVARRAGTGKAPLYRRWSSKAELVLSAVEHRPAEEPRDPVDTGDLRRDLIELLSRLASAMAHPTGRGTYRLVLELILDRRVDPDLTVTVIGKLLRPRLQAVMSALHRAAQRGQLGPGAVTELVARTGPSLVIQHWLEFDSEPTAVDIAAIVDLVLLPALGAKPAPQLSTDR